MAEYPSIVLTNAGLDMIAESQAGQNLIFTKLKIGDGTLGTGESIAALTAIKSPKLDIPIQGFTNQGNGQVRLRYLVDNSGVAANQGFFMREVGIYAKIGEAGTERLYAYTNGGNKVDWIPDLNTPMDAQIFDVFVLIGDASNVTVVINSSATYATLLDLEEHKNSSTLDHPDNSVTDEKIGTRTIIDTTVAAVSADSITKLFSKLGYMIKAITGKANWYTAPAKTIEALNTEKAPLASPTFTGTVTLASDPAADLQAATKRYVDSKAAKDPARVATTANITLSGTQTIDSVAVVAGDRVLVKNQTTGSLNGIYVVAAGAWSRSSDADTSTKVISGMTVRVSEGTTQADTTWLLATNNPITLNTTALSFTQADHKAITASNGITRTGNALSLTSSGVTDAHIGTRTLTDTVVAAAAADTPTNLWSKLGYMIKNITGKTNWYTLPAITLETLSSFVNGFTGSFTANGWIKIPVIGGGNPLIVQWGYFTPTTVDWQSSWPIVFTTACYAAVATADASTTGYIEASGLFNLTTTTFSHSGVINGTGGTPKFWIIAIGR